MRAVLILTLCALIVGCGKEGVIESKQVSSFDQAKFAEEFGALFLADAPLHYKDAHSFLSWLDHEALMSETDMQVVCSELKQFLQRKIPRMLDLNAGFTGVAPPKTVLRAYDVRLLGKFGNLQDVPFLKGLSILDQTAIAKGLRYPNWKNRCTEAIKSIEERNR